MNFLKISLFFLLLSPTLLFAQNYKPGYVVNLKGDTTRGYIDLKEWGKNPTNIYFKLLPENNTPQKYTVNDISYFEVTDITAYRAFNTSISLNETNLQKLQSYSDTSTKSDLIFLKILQTGKNVTLYSFVDDLKERYYIYDRISKTLTELIYRIYFIENDKNNTTTKTQEAYKQQLLLIAQQFPTYNESIFSKLKDANYLGVDLEPICQKINNNNNSGLNHKVNKGKYFKFEIGAGFTLNSINLSGAFPLFYPNTASYSVSPFICASLNFYPAPNVATSVIKLEFSYFRSKNTTKGWLYYYPPIIIGTYSFEQSNFSLTPEFQLSVYNTDLRNIYVNAGFSFNYSTYTGNNVYNPVINENQTNYTGLNKRWLSFPLKVGIILKKQFDCSISYFIPATISNNTDGYYSDYDGTFKLQTIKIGLAYIF